MSLRLAILGTGDFALPTFAALHETDHEVAALVTQPDRTGHGHHRHRNPLKEAALERQTPVFQPGNINCAEALDTLKSFQADLFVVAAYGQILSEAVLRAPRLGAINLHASLLPKYRGAAPIQYAILNGESETGVTIFQIEPALDSGPILAMARTPVGPKETSGDLEERLAQLAGPLTLDAIDRLETGDFEPVSQDATLVTRAPRIKKSDGLIDWSKSAHRIGCHVRAMQPWPKSFTFLEREQGQRTRLIILDAEPAEAAADPPGPGTIISGTADRLIVQTGDGAVEITRLQPEGKRAMAAAEFLRGHSADMGGRFVS